LAKKFVKVNMNLQEKFRIEGVSGNHKVIVDQPKSGGGEDAGPAPLEYFLFGLGGCMLALGQIQLRRRRIKAREFSLTIEGQLDIDGLMGRDPDKRSGFEIIKVKARLDADIDEKEKMEILEEVEKRCPVADNVINKSIIELELD
jgi:uncharacterized OsmC-like protein